jgi:signal transduction histidine kinase
VPVGSTGLLDGRGLVGQILNTGGPSRVEDFEQVGGAVAAAMRSLGLRSGVAGPVVVGGRIWGALVACSAREVPLPPGTEDRIAAFAQLVSLAIENTESRQELAASRARIVKAADEARRRIERDLHDGAQQALVCALMTLRSGLRSMDGDPERAAELLRAADGHLERSLQDLRDLAHGIHPALLAARGLAAALGEVAARTPVPVRVVDELGQRLPTDIEAALYFSAAEAVTNAAKHANPTEVRVDIGRRNGVAFVQVLDDGVGGASLEHGSGLRGLCDRLATLGGTVVVASPPGAGTTLVAEVPVGAGTPTP